MLLFWKPLLILPTKRTSDTHICFSPEDPDDPKRVGVLSGESLTGERCHGYRSDHDTRGERDIDLREPFFAGCSAFDPMQSDGSRSRDLAPKFFGYSKDRADLLSQHALKCPFVNAKALTLDEARRIANNIAKLAKATC